jgi:peroxiredoxin Q/BCP
MTLNIGDKAPDFTLPVTGSATGGETITLSKLKGKPVVVYFYPKDDTPGCTKQACGFRDSFNNLKAHGITVIGISKDDVKSHEKFREKFELNFPLASDESLETIKAYDSWVEKSMYGKKYMGSDRATFLIDATGKLAQIWRNVKVEGHVEEVSDAAIALDKKSQAA